MLDVSKDGDREGLFKGWETTDSHLIPFLCWMYIEWYKCTFAWRVAYTVDGVGLCVSAFAGSFPGVYCCFV